MFKLLRDSIFSPKKIIYYRAKKAWFVILYMLLVSLVLGLSYSAELFTNKSITFSDKKSIVEVFNGSGAKIEGGVYYSSKTLEITVGGYTVTFYPDADTMKKATVSSTDFAVLSENVYLPYSSMMGSSNNYVKISTLTSLSGEFKDVDLNAITVDSAFFNGLTDAFNSFRKVSIATSFFGGVIMGILSMLGYALITYLFLIIFMRAGDYMKKGQLFKMLIFASTAVIFAEAIIYIFNIATIFSWIILLISFIPLYVLEKEIMNRIRIKVMGDGFINNKSVIDKINEALKNNKNNENIDIDADEDDDDDDDDSDSTED